MAAIMASLSAISFTACSDDDDDDDNSSELVGTWVYSSSKPTVQIAGEELSQDNDTVAISSEITFNADGTFETKDGGNLSAGKYSLSGKNLALTVKDENGEEVTYKKGAVIEGLGENGMTVSNKIDVCTAEIKGGQLYVTLKTITTMDMGDMFGDLGDFGDLGFGDLLTTESVTEMVTIYDRKK